MLKILDRTVKDPQHLAHFTGFLIGRNQLDQADLRLAELKKTEPQGPASLELEARLLDLRKRRPELLALLEARGRQVPDQIGLVADLLNRYGFAKEAEQAYKAFIARDPNQAERALALALFLAGKDRVSEAMEIFKKAWATCRPEQVATAALSLYDAPSADQTHRRQVEVWLAAAIRTRPEALGLSTNLGAIWLRQGRFDQAEAAFRRVLSTVPYDIDALNNLAWLLALRDQGKTSVALELIDRAIDARGPVPALIDTRAVVLIRAGQLDKAVEHLNQAKASNAGNPSFALHLAWAYHAQGRIDQARTELKEAEKLGLRPMALDPLERAIVQKLRHDLFPG
jgi:tetratricopeptide (TPR) repeat protein